MKTKRNKPPSLPKNLPAKIDPKAKTPSNIMNPYMYEQIRDYLKNGGERERVNQMIPGHPELLQEYEKYGNEYDRIKQAEYAQEDWEKLKKIVDDMEDNMKMIVSLKRKAKEENKSRKTEHKYQKFFDFLDANIDFITNLIYLRHSPKSIVSILRDIEPALTNMIFHHWKEETELVDELIFAYKASGEEHMNYAKEFMEEWLNPKIHPELNFHHTALVREIGLFHQRFAEYMDRKRWGKKIEIIEEKEQRKVIEGKNLDKLLEKMDSLVERRRKMDEPEESGENIEFTEFEEI